MNPAEIAQWVALVLGTVFGTVLIAGVSTGLFLLFREVFRDCRR